MKNALRFTPIVISLTLAVPVLAAPQSQSAPAKPAAPAAAPAAAAPAAPPPPCTSPEAHQFDFWVGEWDVTWPGPEGKPGGTATNRVEKTLDGCAIEEHFTGLTGNNLAGHSVSLYSVRDKAWKQTWVDNQGAYIDLTGELKNGEIILVHQGTGPDGKPLMSRMVYTNIKPDSFDWRWEGSRDGGATWKVFWPLHYQRKGTAPKG